MKRLLLLLAIAFAPACEAAPPIEHVDLGIAVDCAVDRVEAGRAFDVQVTRTWSKTLAPVPWDSAALAPLVLRLESRDTRDDDTHVQETLRFSAYAFDAADLVLAAPTIEALPRDGGAPRTATAESVDISVISALGPGHAGAVELPGGPIRPSRRWLRWALLAFVFVMAVTAGVRERRRGVELIEAEEPELQPMPMVDPRLLALQRLEVLDSVDGDPVDLHLSIDDILRDFIAVRFGLPAAFMTSDDLLAETIIRDAVAEERLLALGLVFRRCDLVKFARSVPVLEGCNHSIAQAVKFVEAAAKR